MKIEKDPRLWKETNVGLGPAPLISHVILDPDLLVAPVL